MELCFWNKTEQSFFACSVSGDVSILLGSINGASVNTRTAADALISVDFILAVTFGDCFNGARFSASTACYAIVGNFVSHDFFLLESFGDSIVSHF